MFEPFYDMQNTPFTRGIPTSVLYKTHQSSEVFSRLEYTARNQLFAVLIGEPGTGKTSTLRRLKDELPEAEYMVLYISDSKLTPRSFYNYLLMQLGCKPVMQRNTARDLLHKQIEIMRGMRDESPVLLLDDVFSELDRKRQELLLKAISECQTFLTCTHLEELVSAGVDRMQVYSVKNGTVNEI